MTRALAKAFLAGALLFASISALAVERPQRERIGEVLGKPIYRDELHFQAKDDPDSELLRLFTQPAMRHYLGQHKEDVKVTDADIDAVVVRIQERSKRHPSEPVLLTPLQERMLAAMLLSNWKVQTHLYRQFGGGRLLFQQAGVEAFDATHKLLEKLEADGVFRIDDPLLRAAFYDYWTRDQSPFLITDEKQIEQFLDPGSLIAQ